MGAREYFTESKPKGKGKEGLVYDRDLYKMLNRLVYDPERTEGLVDSSQVALNKIGYLSDEEIDGLLGPKTLGAAERYLHNYNMESVWDNIKQMAKGLFD